METLGILLHHAIRAEPHDTEGVERLCRYLVHPPISVERIQYDGTQATYRGRCMNPVSGHDSVTVDPLEMLARLGQHMLPPGMHLTRLYGAFANRTRDDDMLVVGFIFDPAVIRKILQQLPRTEPRAQAPPAGLRTPIGVLPNSIVEPGLRLLIQR